MPCEILIKAFYTHGSYKRGYPVVVKDVPCVWGKKEGLPNFVRIRITDATKAQVNHYVAEQWKRLFTYSIVNQNVLGYRIRIEVDPSVISASGLNKEVAKEIRDFIYEEFGGILVEHGDDYAVFDVPKPIDLREAKETLNDFCEKVIDVRRWYFDDADVDQVVNAGGYMELTKKQVLNRIKDRLAE